MTLSGFEDWRSRFLRDGAPEEEVRSNILAIIDRRTGLAERYKSDPVQYTLELDIARNLRVFAGESQQRNVQFLRRFFLRRFAFGRVREVHRLLKEHCNASCVWLWMGYLIPRVGLAQVLGLGVVLGASGVFGGLEEISRRGPVLFALLVLGVFLALVWGLLFLHVRERIGGPAASVKKRAWALFGLCMIWPALAISLEWLAGKPMGWTFYPWRAVLVNAAALVFALLSQFFFAEDAAMGDPL